MSPPDPRPDLAPPTRLARRLGTGDAVVVGLGAMLGAGVFSAFAPAARAAGKGLLAGLAVAAVLAFANAVSSARLAAVHPESGGAYAYGRRRLSPLVGFVAGLAFVAGKLASCAAMAATFAAHVAPSHARPVAAAAVVSVTVVDLLGIQKSVRVTRVLVAATLASLATVVVAVLFGGEVDRSRLWPPIEAGGAGVLEAAGFLFFAFAGYARLATLGEEVVDPARTIPRAILLALAITFVVYAVVAACAVAALSAPGLASTDAPLAAAVEAGRLRGLAPIVRVGAAVASLGVLLSLTLGVGRTVFAMADAGDLPRALAAVHPRRRTPHRATLAVGTLVAVAACLVELRAAIGFSACCVLLYYAIANAAALTLPRGATRGPSVLALVGLLGCVIVAVHLPVASVAAGAGVVLVGVLGRSLAHRAGRRRAR